MKITVTTKEAIKKHFEKEREIATKTAIDRNGAIDRINKREATALDKFEKNGALKVEQIGLDWTF